MAEELEKWRYPRFFSDTIDEEVDYALSKGATAVHLGERILRCETAPVAALAVLMNLTGNL